MEIGADFLAVGEHHSILAHTSGIVDKPRRRVFLDCTAVRDVVQIGGGGGIHFFVVHGWRIWIWRSLVLLIRLWLLRV